jgi:biopolymer transport protein ExbB
VTRPFVAGLVLLLLAPVVQARSPETLDQLLQYVREQSAAQSRQDAERERRFAAAKAQQQTLLAQAEQALTAERKRGADLQARYDANRATLTRQRTELEQASRSLSDLNTVVRQAAGDLHGLLQGSLVSAQFGGRAAFARRLAGSTQLPSMEALTQLWQTLLQEIVESGKVVRFPATVVTADGEERSTQVTRVGVFDAVAGGRFLRFLPDTGRLMEPARQPPLRFRRLALGLEAAGGGYHPMALDPTRGAMLALLVQTPNLVERIRQGGVIGYIILGLGVLALLVALERFAVLGVTGRRMRRQLDRSQPRADNPLGRILRVYTDSPEVDAETLGLKLDEAILRELPPVRRGLGALSMIAALAPLLGLLGTVVGMIETFQSITLFGTGDPKLMAGGISYALVTTVEGLAVAVPVLLLHSWLSGRSNRLVQILDEQSAAMVARVAEVRHGAAT